MILTVTMNPSIDIAIQLDQLKIDTVNRAHTVIESAGGKGLNVARVAHELGADVIASGPIGSYNGQYLKALLEEDGVKGAFTEIAGETRESLAFLHEGKQTEVLENGPTLSEEEQKQFLEEYQDLLTDEVKVVSLSGSLAKGLPLTYYQDLIHYAHEKGKVVLLDTSGEAFKTSLQGEEKPDLIKPNEEEIAAFLGEKELDFDGLKEALARPEFEGIHYLVVTLGKRGALAKIGDNFYKANIPTLSKDQVVNATGSGDSTVAGMAVAIEAGKTEEEILAYGMTAGILNTMEEKTGHVDKENFETIYSNVKVEKL